jgi:hypothetical protein
LNFGTGLGLSTNPRDQSTRATGGSIKAGQYKDSSSIITGNPQDSIGFSSPKNVLTNPSDPVAPTAAPDLNYKPKTSSEWITQNKESGIADTHANMGSLAMGFRESEAALSAAGKPTVIEARDTEILRSRAAEEHKRLITEPAAAEALKFRSQAAAAKNMFKSRFTSSLQGGRSQGGSYDFNNAGGGGSRGIPTISTPKSFSATATPSNTHGVSAYMNTRQQREAPYLERIDKAPTDNLIGAIKAHSAAPGTNVVTAEEAANKASAENRATPTEMIQARMSAEARKRPNK